MALPTLRIIPPWLVTASTLLCLQQTLHLPSHLVLSLTACLSFLNHHGASGLLPLPSPPQPGIPSPHFSWSASSYSSDLSPIVMDPRKLGQLPYCKCCASLLPMMVANTESCEVTQLATVCLPLCHPKGAGATSTCAA